MALIPPFFLDCVVSIGVAGSGGATWFGTGFIVGRPLPKTEPEGASRSFNTFLVTNKHVLRNRKHVLLRFNRTEGADAIDYPVDLAPGDVPIWVGHPSHEIDVAVFSINPNVLTNDSAVFSFFRLDDHAMGVADMVREGVSEGDSVFTLGFPLGIVAAHSLHVIARSGSIARVRDVLRSQQSAFLIDANIFPGNSGGPVVTRPEISSIQDTSAIGKAALIGIVKSYLPYSDVAVSSQTGNPRVIFEENSGLALVETVDSIKTAVDLCHDLKVAPSL
jgi:S1-C subfamily serine protease